MPVYCTGGLARSKIRVRDVREDGGYCPPCGDVTLAEILPPGWPASEIGDGDSFSDGKVTWYIPAAELAGKALICQCSGLYTTSRVGILGLVAEEGNEGIPQCPGPRNPH